MPGEQKKSLPDHRQSMCISGMWKFPADVWLNPGLGVEVKNFHVFKTAVSVEPPEKVKFAADAGHRVAGAGGGGEAGGTYLQPGNLRSSVREKRGDVENPEVVEPFLTVVTPMNVNALLRHSRGVIVAGTRGVGQRRNFGPNARRNVKNENVI